MEDRADQYFNEAMNLAGLGRYDEAITCLEKAIAIKPNNIQNFIYWTLRGEFLGYLERDEEAIASFDKALALKPDDGYTWNVRGIALLNVGRYAEAVVSFDKAIAFSDKAFDSDQDYVMNWRNRGRALYELGRYEEAIASCDKAIAIDQNDAVSWNYRGFALGEINRLSEALASLDKSLAINSNDYVIWQIRAKVLETLGRYEEAVASCDKAIAIKPDSANSWSERGIELTVLNRNAEAIASYDKALAIDPNDFLVWNNRGLSLAKLGQYAEAVASYDKAISINPSDAVAWNYRGMVQGIIGQLAESLAAFDKAISLKPDFIEALVNRGVALKQLKRYDEAVATYDRVIQLDPHDELAIAGKKELLNKIGSKKQQNREIEDKRPLIQKPQVIRAYEFYAGYIRLKISVKNLTTLTINDVIIEPDVDRAILYLDRYEPEEYPSENERIILGTINPNNDRTVSFYLEPTICAKEGTDVQCHIRYKDAQGKPGSFDMEPLRIQVICPIFETREPVNIGLLKQLIETLPSRDTKIFSVPRNIDAPNQLKIFQSVIQCHDIQHISTLRRANNFESWYYGRTKITQKDMVIKLGIVKDMDMVEITAYSYDPKDLTGLLAEISRHITEEVSKRGNVQKIFNVTIKDSVLTRTNLLNNCDTDGKCSGDVTIADSVVTSSNIG